ncbi:hypothetical protein CHS0354_008955 [Potamilus streckersoni]|uniref:Inter-alpha-trypsin inhibitor heavy chain H3-like n=1 Tax=Potamilus streckersoni TaxID=2493646 RepID=A0AAE0TIF9_9BIVA|nr:hypothetical protein CHS0354_008955 [Potamilus streckersoni]
MARMGKTGSRLFGVRWRYYLIVGFLMFREVHMQGTYNERPEILFLHISSDIKYRFATTLVISHAKNPYKLAKEVVFDVTLPNEAFITDFKMEIDGTVYPGEIKEKEQAKTQYEAARSRGESAAHIKERPRETNKFDVQVNVAAGSMVTFNLTYQELLRRKRGLYHHVVYIDPGQPVLDMIVRVHIQESRKISVVRVPPLRNDISEIKGIATNNLVLMTRPSPNTAFIQFAPTIRQQIDNDQNGISGQFVVEYDIERSRDAGEILVVNGYFVHFFAPSGFKPFPKDVLFIVDESGSMTGKKMVQVKEAMATILSDLHEGDRMNIIAFSTDVIFWKNEMVICTENSIMEAEAFIRGRNADGVTNINKALLDGIKHLLKLEKSEFRKPMIVFLTDGDATQGETNSDRILENIENENKFGMIPIFTLAFGQDADYDLLKSISSRNNGVARRIYEASDAELQITGFYDEISAALMTDLAFQYLDGSVDNATVTKSHFKRYLDGSEMVVAGKMSKEETKTVPLQVIGNSIEGSTVLIINTAILEYGDFTNMTTLDSIGKITEKMWAYLTIKQFMEKMESSTDAAEKEFFKASALALSLKYKLVTPLTSMVVTKPRSQSEALSYLDFTTDFQDDTKSRFYRGNVPSLQSRHTFQTTHRSLVAHFQPPGYRPFVQSGNLLLPPDWTYGSGGHQNLQMPQAIQPMMDNAYISPPLIYLPRQWSNVRGNFLYVMREPDPQPTHLSIARTTMTTPFRTTSLIHLGKTFETSTRSNKGPMVTQQGVLRRENKEKKYKKNRPRRKRYPIRIKYSNTPYATCFNIPESTSYNSDQTLQLFHRLDGIDVNADVGDLAQRNHIQAINVIVKSTLVEINTSAISIVDVNNRQRYDWGNHDMLLPEVKLHVKPSSVKVEAEGLSMLIHKIGNPSKGLGLFINDTTLPQYPSATGLLAKLAGGISSSYGIRFSGHAAGFYTYTLIDLKKKDTWHGDSKCYTVQNDTFW